MSTFLENNFNFVKSRMLQGLIIILGVFLLLGAGIFRAEAAILTFTPAAGSYSVGGTFSVRVNVSSSDQAMNGASGVVTFPNDLLEVTSVSKTNSIFSLWVQDPSFSNIDGTVNFEGVVLNPGFTGNAGQIMTVFFRVKALGTASISFSSGSVLANDGNGTNILGDMGAAKFTLGSANVPSVPKAVAPKPQTAGIPAAPDVSSQTHPDSNKWYAVKDARLVWTVPQDVTGVRLSVGKIPRITPTVNYVPVIGEKEIPDVGDGISYFHAQFKNAEGWGDVAHFRIQIDTEKPTRFDIVPVSRDDATDPKARFIFNAKDELSGIDHYEIKIDDKNSETWVDDGNHRYETPIIGLGKHTLFARAVDKAGNYLINSAEFTVEALEVPRIKSYPKQLESGATLVVSGTTYANSQVLVWLQLEGSGAVSHEIQSGWNGEFNFVSSEKIPDGVYTLWAEVVDKRGAHSKPSDKLNIVVSPSALIVLGNKAVSFLSVLVPLVAMVIALAGTVVYGFYKLRSFKRKIRGEVREVETVLHKAFDLLKEDVREQIKMLERTRNKRQLTEEEEKIVKQLKKDMDSAEKLVRKEIQEIEANTR